MMICEPGGKYAKSSGGPDVGDAHSVWPSSSTRFNGADAASLSSVRGATTVFVAAVGAALSTSATSSPGRERSSS
jgi:hypothetical protein